MKTLFALLFILGSIANAKRVELSAAEREFELSWFNTFTDAGFRGEIVTPLPNSHFYTLSASRIFKFTYWPTMPRHQLNFPIPLEAYARLLEARYKYEFILAFSTGEHGGYQGAVVSAQQMGEAGPRYLIVTPTTDEATVAHEIQHIKDVPKHWVWEREAHFLSPNLSRDQVSALFTAVSELRAWCVHVPLSLHPFESEYATFYKTHLEPYLRVLDALRPREVEGAVRYLDNFTDDFAGNSFREHVLKQVHFYVERVDSNCESMLSRKEGLASAI